MDEPRKRRHLVLCVENDPDVDSPCDDDCTWKLYSFSRKHNSFKDPDELDLNGKEMRDKFRRGLAHRLSYFEHGNCAWMLAAGPHPAGVEFQWDGVRFAGVLVWEHDPKDLPGTIKKRTKYAEAFLETYTSWCNGECCWFSLETDDGENVDSCGGFYSFDEMMDVLTKENRTTLEKYPGWPIVIEGDLKDLLQYHPIAGHEYVDSVEELEDMLEPEYTI